MRSKGAPPGPLQVVGDRLSPRLQRQRGAGHHGLLDALNQAAADGFPPLTDTGYEGAPASFRMPHKKPAGCELTDDKKQLNKAIGAIRALAEKANADLKTRFKALRRVSLAPQRIGDIVAAALALFHHEKGRRA